MPIEKSAGAIIFKKNKEIKYLLLHYPTRAKRRVGDEGKLRRRQTSSTTRVQRRVKMKANPKGQTSSTDAKKEYWDFPKGHIEKGEKEIETVKREVEEETGLKDIKFVEGFEEWFKYFFKFRGRNILKFVTFYLAETPHRNKFGAGQAKEVKISKEHIGYEWLPFEKALEKLTFDNAKEILRKANNFLSEKSV